MSKKDNVKDNEIDISKLSLQEREALAEQLFEKAMNSSKRNNDNPEERYTEDILSHAIELCPKPKYYYVKAHELFWQYSMWDEADIMDEIRESPYTKPSRSLADNSDKYRELLELTFKALELNPDYSQAYDMSARIYNQLGEYDKALVDINKALSMRPESSFYYYTFHEILLNLGDLTGALTAINKALELNPDGYRLMENKCNLMIRMGRYQEAVDFLKTFPVKGNYGPLIAYSDISVGLLLKIKDTNAAREVLIELLKTSYRMFQVNHLLTDLYEKGEYELLASLPLREKKMNLKVLWILFWANIHVGDFGHACDILDALHFSKELTTDSFDNETVEIDELTDNRKEASSEIAEFNKQEATSEERFSKFHYSISRLFSLAQPYEKVPMDIFMLLLRKIFNGRYAKHYFEARVCEYKGKWETEPELISQRATYGEQYHDISLKIMLLGDVAQFVYKLNKKKAVIFSLLQNAMNTSLIGAMNSIMLKVQLEERNRILANLSHSIKNMLKAVIDPLVNLREELPQKAVIIDNAIKGANLIREIVNAINLSFKTTLDELQWDVLNPGGESMTLQDMVVDSLRYSVSNMFDSRYFPSYSENYFPRSLAKDHYDKIRSQWSDVSAGNVRQIKGFLDEQMFLLELDLDESRDYHVGNEKSSAIKLLILFQEIIFNAVKYASYVPYSDRQVVIMLASYSDKLKLTVRNSFNPKVQAKTTGVGRIVIENFARVLGCEPMIITDSNTYSISLEFNNIWRNNAENTVH